MHHSRALGALALLATTVLATSGCALNEISVSKDPRSQHLSGVLSASGASSQGVAQTAWIAGFYPIEPDVRVNYAGGGSGAGRSDFQNGTSAFIGSDRAFDIDEIAEGPFRTCADGSDLVEIPAYISPIAVAFALEGVDELRLDAPTIAGIFAGDIASWDAPEIAALNPDASLPSLAITPVHRSDKSGTTGNFTAYLDEAAGDAWSYGEVDEWPVESGEAAQESAGMQQALRANGTIGYMDASAAAGLKTASVETGGEFVPFSPEAAAAVVDNSTIEAGRAATDLAFELNRTTPGVYPIVLVSYLIGCAEYADADEGINAKAYFSFVVSEEGQSASAEAAGSAPISDSLRAQIEPVLEQMK
ncbi:phosphate ABC transporter substrate-binding protein PstS [Pseudoclavibacter helvolus]|uniref:phosphate ABC transporter substrate-binding protein PstS n=1 Tax=Pseudoclavibacter helvolus TaxID=255205 RepID=UPI003736375F